MGDASFAQIKDAERWQTVTKRPAGAMMAVCLQRAGAGVEPPRSQLLSSKHTQQSQEQHVSQPGKKGQVEEPLDGQNELYRQTERGCACVCVCVSESKKENKGGSASICLMPAR